MWERDLGGKGSAMDANGTIRWGILGAGGIAHRFARALEHVEGAELVAVSARSPQKAAAFAAEFGVAPERAYADVHGPGSAHDMLVADPEVDAIYLALPHALHLAWAERALRAGKVVLCEKPAALTADQARRIAAVSLATGSLFMEAMKTRFEPAYREVRRIIGTGAIGRPVRVEARLMNDVPRERWESSSYYLDPVGGGCLLDTGIYCACWLDDLLPGSIAVVSADAAFADARPAGNGPAGADSADRGGVPAASRSGAPAQVDVWDRAELSMGAGTGVLECSFDRAGSRQAVIAGECGKIVVDDLHRPQRFTVTTASVTAAADTAAAVAADTAAGEALGAEANGAERAQRFEVPYEVDDFYPQIKHFCDLVRAGAGESPIMPLASTIRCAEILDAVRAAVSAC